MLPQKPPDSSKHSQSNFAFGEAESFIQSAETATMSHESLKYDIRGTVSKPVERRPTFKNRSWSNIDSKNRHILPVNPTLSPSADTLTGRAGLAN